MGALDQSLLLLPESWQPDFWLGIHIPGLGVILTGVVIVVTGLFAANLIGQRLVLFWESLLHRIPGGEIDLWQRQTGFRQPAFRLRHGVQKSAAGALPASRMPGRWRFRPTCRMRSKRQLDAEHVAVFIPTTPSPVNGFYFYVRRDAVIELDMSVDAALKAIVSMGVVAPVMKPDVANYPGD
jgi:uncharacterized membrane protein